IDSGYILNGHVPWVTGWTFFPEFLIGAALPDGQSVFAVVPLVDLTQESRDNRQEAGFVCVSPPMELAAMGTAMTVAVDFKNYFVPDEKVAFLRAAGWIQNSDSINIALQGHLAIGFAMAGIDV